MKNKLRLSAAAMLSALSVTTASAQWSAPTPTPSMLGGDSLFYFYNPDAAKFLMEGNAWGTQTSVSNRGLQIRISQVEEGMYTLQDSSEIKSAWKYIFINGPTESFVDMGSQGNNTFALTNSGGFNYRISGNGAVYNAESYPNCYYGWDSSLDNTIVYPLLDMSADEAPNYKVDWQLIEPANYFMHQARFALYSALLEASEAGVSTAAAGAVYNNATASMAELQEATRVLQTAIKEGMFVGATADSPKDVTGIIVNPNFENAGDVSGWVSTTGASNQTTATNQDGAFTHPFYENWSSTAYTGKVSQKLTGVPNGVYKLSAALSGNNNGPLYLFANEDKTLSQSSEPTFYEVFTVLTTDTLEIGMMQDEAVNNWICMDTYTLFYYGSGADAYKLMLKQAIDNTIALEDMVVGAPEKTALEAEVTAANAVYNNASATAEEALAARTALVAAVDAAYASASAYNALKVALDEAEQVLNDFTFGADELSDYYMETFDAYEQATLSAAECTEAVETLAQLILDAKNNAVVVGDNTRLLTNPDFSNGNTGWSTGIVNYNTIEVFYATFDMNQKIVGLPNGKYTVTCNAYFRTLPNAEADTQYAAGSDEIRCMLYANAAEVAIANVMSGGLVDPAVTGNGGYPDDYLKADGLYAANSQQGAELHFAAGQYENTVSVVVTNKELQVGIKLSDATGYSDYWMCADNFTLYYHGDSEEVLAEEVQTLVALARELTDQKMSATARGVLESAITSADTEAAMIAINNLNEAIPAARTSIAAYAPLAEALVYAETRTGEVEASAGVTAAFIEVYEEIAGNYSNGTYEDDEIEAAITALNAAVNAYLTGDVEASDDNPVDMTSMIVNADMTNGQTGWTNPGPVSYELMEKYNTAFDVFQTLSGVPNGTYKVTVQGFYRAGGYAAAATSRDAGTEALNAMLYANNKTTPIMSLLDETMEDAYVTGAVLAGDYGYVPNSMQGAGECFGDGMYNGTELFVNVTDGTLVIGVKKSELISSDWCSFTNFTLTYYGENSTNSVEDAFAAEGTPESTEYFNVSGAKQAGLVKGMNIVRTKFTNGQVKVSKVMVK